MNLSKKICLTYLIVIPVFGITKINAQNLPSVQNTGYFAPANIKIDGKVNDWGNRFQANNKHNQIRYTIANNRTNLYFVMQTSDIPTIKKIAGNGMTLIITSTKKKLDNALTITFPAYNKNQHRGCLLQDTKPGGDDTLGRRFF